MNKVGPSKKGKKATKQSGNTIKLKNSQIKRHNAEESDAARAGSILGRDQLRIRSGSPGLRAGLKKEKLSQGKSF